MPRNWTFAYSVESSAPPSAAWRVWSEADQMERLPCIRSLISTGRLDVGTRVMVRAHGAPTQRLVITQVDPGRCLVFESHQGSVTGTYTITVEPSPGGGSRLTARVDLPGRAARLNGFFFGRMIARSVGNIVDDVAAAAVARTRAEPDPSRSQTL